MTFTSATQGQIEAIKQTLLDNKLFSGHFDRLWKLLEAHEVDVRTPGDGSRMSYETAEKTIKWLEQGLQLKRWTLATRQDPAAQARYEAAATRNGASREDLRQRRNQRDDLRRPGRVNLEPGGYATPSRTGNNDLDFWWVDRPEEGRWAGWTFAERVIGGRSNQRISRDEQIEALAAIAAGDPQAAQALFGHELGQCYRCNRHLTDETSRELGIGPVCRELVAA